MRIFLNSKHEYAVSSYDVPIDGLTIPHALGDWSLEARAVTPNGKIRILIWDPNKRPDLFGRIKPVRESVLSFAHPSKRFMKGLFGFGGSLQVTRSMRP